MNILWNSLLGIPENVCSPQRLFSVIDHNFINIVFLERNVFVLTDLCYVTASDNDTVESSTVLQ